MAILIFVGSCFPRVWQLNSCSPEFWSQTHSLSELSLPGQHSFYLHQLPCTTNLSRWLQRKLCSGECGCYLLVFSSCGLSRRIPHKKVKLAVLEATPNETRGKYFIMGQGEVRNVSCNSKNTSSNLKHYVNDLIFLFLSLIFIIS